MTEKTYTVEVYGFGAGFLCGVTFTDLGEAHEFGNAVCKGFTDHSGFAYFVKDSDTGLTPAESCLNCI